jgi:hypothetical protein
MKGFSLAAAILWYFIAGIIASIVFPGGAPANDETGVVTVQASDLLSRVRIIGELGQPLGQLVTIRGKWQPKDGVPKVNELLFETTQINGKKTVTPLVLPHHRVKPIVDRGRSPGHTSTATWDWKADWLGDRKAPNANSGDEWEMVGFETGTIIDWYSKEAHKEFDASLAQGGEESGFVTRYVFIGVRRITNDK